MDYIKENRLKKTGISFVNDCNKSGIDLGFLINMSLLNLYVDTA